MQSSTVELSDDELDDEALEQEENVTAVPSTKEVVQKMAEIRSFLQSREVPENIWNSFSVVDSYVTNIGFSSRFVQKKISELYLVKEQD